MTAWYEPENKPAGSSPTPITVTSPGASSGARTVNVNGWPSGWVITPPNKKILSVVRMGVLQGNIEITAQSGGSLTVTGVVDGYTDFSLQNGDVLESRPSKALFTQIQSAIDAGAAGGGMTVLTGDVTATGTGTVITTLVNTAVTPGSYTLSSVTIDSKGRITAASNGAPATKSSIGLGLVENTALSLWSGSTNLTTLGTVITGSLDTARITSGTMATSRLGSGIPDSTTFLRGDQVWATPAGSGTVTTVSIVTSNGISGSVANPTTTPAITLSIGTGAITAAQLAGSIPYTKLIGTDIVTVGTIGLGTWQGTPIAAAYLANTAVTPGTYTAANITIDAQGRITAAASGAGGGGGTVTTVSVVTANGISGSVATNSTTPAITLTLGAITPTSIVSSGIITGSNISGTNTGDQTITLTGNVTGTGTGSFSTTIASGVVTTAMMANMSTASILGRNTAGSGAPEVLSVSTTKSLLSLNLVENTALSTWAGSANITTLGTVTTGSLDAARIASGTMATARLGSGSASSTTFLRGDQIWTSTGTVTTVSIVTANGISGSVANATTTPAITLTIGAGAITNAQLAGSIAYTKLVGTDIVTVGTIGTGIWQGTAVAIGFGGTGSSTAAGARTTLGVAATCRNFGCAQYAIPIVNDVTPSIFLNRAYTCDGIEAACFTPPTGTASLKLQTSTNGTTWTDLATVSITTGAYSGSVACATAITAGTLVRGIFTAASGVTGMVATLYLKG